MARTMWLAGALALVSFGPELRAGYPYLIVDLGVVNVGDSASQGFGMSPGGVATGRSFGNPTQAFYWTDGGGLVGLPNLPTRPFGVGNDAADNGVVVGTGATTSFGSSPLPLIWQSGLVSQLPLPVGETFGRANGVNAATVAVGSVGSGSGERGVIYSGGNATIITAATPTGCTMTTAFKINDAGLVVGTGIDPNNAARNVGFVYDSILGQAFEVGALPGFNGALAFDVSNAGHVVGSSMLNQGSGLPFVWTAGGGMVEIPLPAGTSTGSGRGVNAAGLVVGNAGGVFSVPWLYDGAQTHRLQDLVDPASGWDLSMNTSSSALGVSESGAIVGTGIHNGQTRAYVMIPVGAPKCVGDVDGDGRTDQSDLGVLLSNFGQSVPPDTNGDLDGDGFVGQSDLGILLGDFNCGV